MNPYIKQKPEDWEVQMNMNEWMKAVRKPIQYRVGSSAIYFKSQHIFNASVGLVVIFMFICLCKRDSILSTSNHKSKVGSTHLNFESLFAYNQTYPFSKPVVVPNGKQFRIGLIADLDTKSFVKKNTWGSYLKTGYLFVSDDKIDLQVQFDDDSIMLKSSYSFGGRGMELSELIVFNGGLYSIDDRTGILYEITNDRNAVPWIILPDGDGHSPKGFKGEWACVKDKHLWIGGLGKEWTTVTGEVLNINPQWVKVVNPQGAIIHFDWHENYNKLREKGGFSAPGYLIHESAMWSNIHNKWFFLPRRASREKYDEVADEKRAANLLIMADEDFNEISIQEIGILNPTHGFSSFKFIPETNDKLIIALKTVEDGDFIGSYITIFNINGNILLEEKFIENIKYEGIEFI